MEKKTQIIGNCQADKVYGPIPRDAPILKSTGSWFLEELNGQFIRGTIPQKNGNQLIQDVYDYIGLSREDISRMKQVNYAEYAYLYWKVATQLGYAASATYDNSKCGQYFVKENQIQIYLCRNCISRPIRAKILKQLDEVNQSQVSGLSPIDKLNLEKEQEYQQQKNIADSIVDIQSAQNAIHSTNQFYFEVSSSHYKKSYVDIFLELICKIARYCSVEVLRVFPKDCPGCLMFGLSKIGYQHKDLREKIMQFFKILFCDPESHFIEKEAFDQFCDMVRREYPPYKQSRTRRDFLDENEIVCLSIEESKVKKAFDEIESAFRSKNFIEWFAVNPRINNQELERLIRSGQKLNDFINKLDKQKASTKKIQQEKVLQKDLNEQQEEKKLEEDTENKIGTINIDPKNE